MIAGVGGGQVGGCFTVKTALTGSAFTAGLLGSRDCRERQACPACPMGLSWGLLEK